MIDKGASHNRYAMISHNSAEFGGEVACLWIAITVLERK